MMVLEMDHAFAFVLFLSFLAPVVALDTLVQLHFSNSTFLISAVFLLRYIHHPVWLIREIFVQSWILSCLLLFNF